MKGFCCKQKSRLLPTAVVFFTLQTTVTFAGGYASGWDCQNIDGGDWVCRSSQTSRYHQSLDDISDQRQQIAGTFAWLKVNVSNLSERIAKTLPSKKIQKVNPRKVADKGSATGEYTIQWLVARSVEPVKRLKNRLKLPESRILKYKKYNADWYVLVQGQYPTEVAAENVLDQPAMIALNKALRPRVRQSASFDALGAVALIPQARKNTLQQRIAKMAAPDVYKPESYKPESYKPESYKPESVAERIMNDRRRRIAAAAKLPVKPLPIKQRPKMPRIISYVRKESVITQDYQAPVMAPRLPLSVPYPVTGSKKQPVTQFPVASMTVTDLQQAAQGSHTIQWYAAETLLEARQFKAYYPALQSALIARTDNRGRSWYLVLQGIFRDGSSAMNELQQPGISAVANMLSPWVRPVAGLRKLQAVQRRKSHPTTKASQVINLPSSSLNLSPLTKIAPLVNNAPLVNSALALKPAKDISLNTESVQPLFMQAPDSSFTIQWYAANDPFQVKKFQARYPKLSQARIVYFKRNGLDWYVLVDGVFESNYEAVGFLKSNRWQPLANHLHPWARSFKGLKKLAAREIGWVWFPRYDETSPILKSP